MQWLRSLVARYPSRTVFVGKFLLIVGSTLVLGALFARAGLINVNAERTEAKLPILRTLAEAYPQYPTGLVPEGPLGYAITALLVLAGVVLVSLAEKERR